MRILILDDEINIVNGLAFMAGSFELPHCMIDTETDPLRALETLRHRPADLVIVDINMPGMSGLEFIQAAQELGQTRFVILSGHSDFSYAQQAIRLHVADYLIKPVDTEELKKILTGLFMDIYHIDPESYVEMSSLKLVRLLSSPNHAGRQLSSHMKNILAYIREHYTDDVSITRLGEEFGLHPNYISALFFKETKISLHKYVQTMKLMKAMQLLANSPEITMADIAAQLGYSNERQFFRMFKQLAGQTPGQFREEHQPGRRPKNNDEAAAE